MNRSIKAALLSALVYPGAGHFFLKKHLMGLAFVGAFSIPLIHVVNFMLTKANQIAEKINTGEIPLDIEAITEAVSNLLLSTGDQELNTSTYAMIVLWVLAIVHSYWVARDKQ